MSVALGVSAAASFEQRRRASADRARRLGCTGRFPELWSAPRRMTEKNPRACSCCACGKFAAHVSNSSLGHVFGIEIRARQASSAAHPAGTPHDRPDPTTGPLFSSEVVQPGFSQRRRVLLPTRLQRRVAAPQLGREKISSITSRGFNQLREAPAGRPAASCDVSAGIFAGAKRAIMRFSSARSGTAAVAIDIRKKSAKGVS